MKKLHCEMCEQIYHSTSESALCDPCRTARIMIRRSVNAMMLLHGVPLASGICQDCGTRPATCRDHRHYGSPLKVAYVCTPCNIRRGAALDLKQLIKAHRGLIKIEEDAPTQQQEQEAKQESAAIVFPIDLQQFMNETEKRIIEEALTATRCNRTAAARILGLSFRAIRYRIERLDIKL